jgi:hypothetical protein
VKGVVVEVVVVVVVLDAEVHQQAKQEDHGDRHNDIPVVQSCRMGRTESGALSLAIHRVLSRGRLDMLGLMERQARWAEGLAARSTPLGMS